MGPRNIPVCQGYELNGQVIQVDGSSGGLWGVFSVRRRLARLERIWDIAAVSAGRLVSISLGGGSIVECVCSFRRSQAGVVVPTSGLWVRGCPRCILPGRVRALGALGGHEALRWWVDYHRR